MFILGKGSMRDKAKVSLSPILPTTPTNSTVENNEVFSRGPILAFCHCGIKGKVTKQ